MAELRLGVVDLARASGLSEKHVRTLLNDGPSAVPRDQTRWALCDALRWTPDSIDRILDGFEPVDVDDSGDISRLDLIDARLQEIEAVASTGLGQLRNQQLEMEKFYRLHRRLEDEVRVVVADRVAAVAELAARLEAVERALAELRQAQRPDDAAQP